MEQDFLKPEEVATKLQISKYTVYEMVKRGELQAIRIGRKMRFDPKTIKEFTKNREQYEGEQATRLNRTDESEILISSIATDEPISGQSILFLGSHDLAIEQLGNEIKRSYPDLQFFTAYTGSMDGLLNLYFGKADIAGCHLFDEETGKYNLPFVRRVFSGEDMKIIHFVKRNIGWIVPKGNPNKTCSWEDLARPNLRVINRQKGAGTRILLDYQIKKQNLSKENIIGYDDIEQTHYGVASRVARGLADMALGTESAAVALGLDFVFLLQEQYDFVMKTSFYESQQGQAFLTALHSKDLHTKIAYLGGYDTKLIGEIMKED